MYYKKNTIEGMKQCRLRKPLNVNKLISMVTITAISIIKDTKAFY